MATNEKSLLRSVANVSIITFISRIAGLVRDMGLVLFFAPVAWALDSFYFAFTIPNLFRRLLGDGALAAAFIPEFATAREENDRPEDFASSVLSMLFACTAIATVVVSLGCLGAAAVLPLGEKPVLTLVLTAIMLPFASLVCTGAIMGALCQSLRHFSLPAAVSIIINLCIIASLGYIAFVHWPAAPGESFYATLKSVPLRIPKESLAQMTQYVAWSVLLSGVIQVLVMYPALRIYGLRLRPLFHFRGERIRAVFRHMGPTTLGLGIVQINVFTDNVISYWLSTHTIDGQTPFEGATTYLFLGNRLMQLPLGVFAVAIASTAFPVLSTLAAKKESEKLTTAVFSAFRMQLFIMLPVAATLIVLAPDIVRLLYQGQNIEFTDAAVYRTSAVLVLLSAGLPFYGMQQVMSRAYYAVKDYTTPVKIAAGLAGLNFVLNLLLLYAPDLYRHWVQPKLADGMPAVKAWGQDSFFADGQGLALGEAGLALSTAFCAGLSVWLLWRKLQAKLAVGETGGKGAARLEHWDKAESGFLLHLPGMVGSAIALAVMLWFTLGTMPYAPEFWGRVVRLVVPCLLAAIFYPVVCSLLMPQEYDQFMSRLRKRNAAP